MNEINAVNGRVRKRPLTKRQKVRVGFVVWLVRKGIRMGIKLESRTLTSKGRRQLVEKRQRDNDILQEDFYFLDYRDESKVYVSDVLKELDKDLQCFIMFGTTPKRRDGVGPEVTRPRRYTRSR